MKRIVWIAVISILLLAYLAWNQLQPLLALSGSGRALQQRIAASDPSVMYVLGKNDWTEFNIPKGIHSLRLVTNATLPADFKVEPNSSWPYILQFEFLDNGGRVLLQRDYSYRSSLRIFQDKTSGTRFSASFYLEPELMPTDGHVVMLNLSDLPQVSSMRVKIRQTDPSIIDVGFRAYAEEILTDYRLAHRWLRLSEEQKAKLGKGNVYSHDMLAENEIRNLLRGQDRPLGPTGIVGRAYSSRTLYVMREYTGQEVGVPVLPAGVYVDENIHGVIPLPEGGGKVRLNFVPLGLVNAPEPGSKIKIRWYGRKITQRSQTIVTWRGEGTRVEANWKGGLLEVVAQGGLAVRAYMKQDGQEQEITPDNLYLRAFSAQESVYVEYAVDHVRKDPTPFRMDIRHTLLPGEVAEENPVWVTYQLLNHSGSVVREGSILAAPPLSVYERLIPDTLGLRMSDPSTYYFSLPAGIASVRLFSDKPALLSGYTRPWELVRESRVPEDAYVTDDNLERQLSWFPLKPINFQALVLANRSMLVATQYRPPQDNPDMLAGRYQWQDFHPRGNWLGRTLFTPVDDAGPAREDALPSTFLPIEKGRETTITLLAAKGVKIVQPTLAYFRSGSEPFEIRMLVDGRPYYQGKVAGSDGEIGLPSLYAGKHIITLQTDMNAGFYLNHTAPGRSSLLKRLGNIFEHGKLDFDYAHGTHCQETMGMRLFTPQGKKERSVLSVRIDPPKNRIVGPLSGWSFINRRFDVRPEMLSGSRVASHRLDATDEGQPFFIPMAQDLPPGNYRVRTKLEHGPGGYFLLSRIVPGLAGERKVMMEQEPRHVDNQE